MDEIDWPTLAERQPLLAAMPRALLGAAKRRPFVAGTSVFRQGQRPAAMSCVLAGELRLLRRNTDGGEVVLQRCRGGFFAEASLQAAAYHCDAVAVTSGELLRFPLAAFRSALADDAEFNGRWIAHLSAEVRRLRAQCERLAMRSAAARVIHCIQTEGRDGRLTLGQSRKAWAAELGLTHEALYRALARLAADGTLASADDTLVLMRPTPASPA